MRELLLVITDELLAVHFLTSVLGNQPVVLVSRIERHRLTQARNGAMTLPPLGLLRGHNLFLLLVRLNQLKSSDPDAVAAFDRGLKAKGMMVAKRPVKKIVNEQGIVIDKIYNPSVGKYDVVVVTGPGYATKRQEALEAMAQLLQGNPQLWGIAGDLFVKNMDWPGAQEMAKRFAKTIDPKILGDADEDPALQAANQQIQAMGAEMEQMHKMLQNINQTMEARTLEINEFKAQTDADIKAYEAETRRLQAVAAGMQPEQVQEVVMQTLRDVLTAGDLVQPMEVREMPEMMPPPEMAAPMEGPMQ